MAIGFIRLANQRVKVGKNICLLVYTKLDTK